MADPAGRRARSWHGWAWAAAVLALPTAFVLLPLLSFVLTSFWRLEDGQIVRSATLDNYRAFFTSEGFLEVYGSTVLLCLQVTVLNVGLGYAAALFVLRRPPRLRLALLITFVVPLFLSYIIKIYAVRGILGQRGLLNEALLATGLVGEPLTFLLFSRPAVFVTLVVVYLPFAVLPIYLALERVPPSLLAASADLGGGVLDELRYILLPLSAPGVAAAAVFSFVLALGDFVTPQMVGGTGGFTFGRIVYSQFGLALNWPLGAALAVVLLATALLAMALAAAVAARERVA